MQRLKLFLTLCVGFLTVFLKANGDSFRTFPCTKFTKLLTLKSLKVAKNTQEMLMLVFYFVVKLCYYGSFVFAFFGYDSVMWSTNRKQIRS